MTPGPVIRIVAVRALIVAFTLYVTVRVVSLVLTALIQSEVSAKLQSIFEETVNIVIPDNELTITLGGDTLRKGSAAS